MDYGYWLHRLTRQLKVPGIINILPSEGAAIGLQAECSCSNCKLLFCHKHKSTKAEGEGEAPGSSPTNGTRFPRFLKKFYTLDWGLFYVHFDGFLSYILIGNLLNV